MNTSSWYLDELNMSNLATGYEYIGGNFVAKLHRGHPAYPGISLRTTALELANYIIMLLNDGIYKGKNILSSDAIDSMATVQNPDWSFSYGTTGLGIFKRDDYGERIVWGHNGGSSGGYAAHFYFCKGENSGIVITTNSEQYVDPIVEYLFDYALTITNISEVPEYRNVNMSVYPNPANDQLTISYQLKEAGTTLISIFSNNGQLMETLSNEFKLAGEYSFVRNISDYKPGIYFCRIQIGNEMVTKKIIKVK